MAVTAPLTPAEQIQQIDVVSFFEAYSTVHAITYSRRDGCKEFHGSCPWCEGTDRFTFWETGRWSCSLRSSGCGRHGSSPIWFLVEYKGISPAQACEELGLEPGSRWTFDESMLKLPSLDDPPCEAWQESGKQFVQRAQRYLWTRGGEGALIYLQSRGFTDETIKKAGLGYCPLTKEGQWFEQPLSDWGLTQAMVKPAIWQRGTIRIPPGIIIPWFIDGDLWKICVKRYQTPKEAGKYGQVVGSAEGLYNADSVKPGLPVVMVEGEFDALSVMQTAGDLIGVVATGSTTHAFTDQWKDHLCMASLVLQSFDADEAGRSAAQNWLRLLPNSMRWRPLAHDCNDMLKEGKDLNGIGIREWVEAGIELAQEPIPETTPVSPASPDLADLLNENCACGQPVDLYTFDMYPPVGVCAICARYSAPHPCSALEAFAVVVQAATDLFAPCTVERLAPGTTMQSYLTACHPDRVVRDPIMDRHAVTALESVR